MHTISRKETSFKTCASKLKSLFSPHLISSSPLLLSTSVYSRSTLLRRHFSVRTPYELEAQEFKTLIDKVSPLIVEYYRESGQPNETPLCNHLDSQSLGEELDLSLPLSHSSACSSTTSDQIVRLIKQVLKYSVRTQHPRFFDKLYAGSDPVGQVAELITALLNTNVHTFAVSPVFSVLEKEVIQSLSSLAGFDTDFSDGILCPGGTFANTSALLVARDQAFPWVRKEGWRSEDKPVCLTSAQAHYSIQRAAMIAGMGMDSCVTVAADRKGRMIPSALEKTLTALKEQGKRPFFVSSTAGTTVMGGFDPLSHIRSVCDQHQVDWFHVDGAWGGACLMSRLHRHLMEGVHLADSLTWNPHKALGVPIFTSALLINNHPGALERANSSNAEYLFHQHEASAYDLGDKSLQCGRRADSLKLWLSWKRHGIEGFEKRIDRAYALSQRFADIVKERDLLELLSAPSSSSSSSSAAAAAFILVENPMSCNICFWYIPQSLRNERDLELIREFFMLESPHGKTLSQEEEKQRQHLFNILDQSTSDIYSAMQQEGKMLCNYNPLSDHRLPKFFRLIINQSHRLQTELLPLSPDILSSSLSVPSASSLSNHDLGKEDDLQFVLDTIQTIGDKICR